MKLIAVITVLFTADLAHCAKWTQKRHEARAARRAVPRPHSSKPVSNLKHEGILTNNTHLAYSENWAGAALVSSNFTSVTGTIVVPSPTAPNDGQEYAGAAWVGIDGNTCTTAILQTGIDWYVQSNGQTTYDAWYEWYPDYSYDFPASSLALAAGNVVRMTVTATSPTSGSALLENLTTGQRAAQTFTDITDGTLCETDAEWIIEDFEGCDAEGNNCGLVPFADFGTVTFSNCSATQAGAQKVTPGSAGEGLMVIDIYQDSEVLTDCTVSGGTVACTYQ